MVIVVCLLSHRDCQYKCKWGNVCENETDLESRNELRERDEEKVQVEEEFELFVEHDGEESDDVVFLIADDVRCEAVL